MAVCLQSSDPSSYSHFLRTQGSIWPFNNCPFLSLFQKLQSSIQLLASKEKYYLEGLLLKKGKKNHCLAQYPSPTPIRFSPVLLIPWHDFLFTVCTPEGLVLRFCVLFRTFGQSVQACRFHCYDPHATCHLATSRDEFFVGIDWLR